MINDKQYLSWQAKLKSNTWFRRFWVFWGIYSIVLYAALAAVACYKEQSFRPILVSTFVVLITHFVISKITHLFYKKAHPYQRLMFRPPWSWLFSLTDTVHDSFPSEHSSATAAIAISFLPLHPILAAIGLALAVMVGFSRVLLGYHEPSDIIGGLIVGILSGFLLVFGLIPHLFT